MPNASWPASLPQWVLESGFSEALPDTNIETQMEAGAPKVRRRFTSNTRPFSLNVKMDAAQKATFDTFYVVTLKGGSLPFDWVHPVSRAAATFRFRKPVPKFSAVGPNYIAAFAAEIIA